MVIRLAFVIILSVFIFILDGTTEARASSCLQCHSVHYASLGNCVSCHRGDPRSSRPAVSHRNLIPGRFSHYALPESPVTEKGSQHLKTAGCRRCHLIAGKGNRLAADLDTTLREAPVSEVFEAIRQPAFLMPDFRFTAPQTIELVNALLAAARQSILPAEEVPRLIHFIGDREKERENTFSRHCGECHRMMSPILGGAGRGKIGPNLSGLFTEFYPGFSYNRKRWTGKILRKWLQNPRNLRPEARMPPVKLQKQELNSLLNIFTATAVRKKGKTP